MLWTGWLRADALASLLVAALMLRSAYGLLRDSGRIFLEAAPAGLDPGGSAARSSRSRTSPRSTTCTCGRSRPASRPSPRTCSSHATATATRPAGGSGELLDERFALGHTTLQVDHARSQGALQITTRAEGIGTAEGR